MRQLPLLVCVDALLSARRPAFAQADSAVLPGDTFADNGLLDGVGTIRGVRENAVRGPAFWLARAETGVGLARLRRLVFLDVGQAGERDAFHRTRPAAGGGAGLSLIDGLLRFDLARGVARSAA